MQRDDERSRLSTVECWARLAGAPLARLALTEAAMPVIAPVRHCVVGHDVIFGINEPRLLRAALAQDVVCVEADAEWDDAAWSVVGAGTLEIITQEERSRSLHALVPSPWEGGEVSHIVRIRLSRIAGTVVRSQSSPACDPTLQVMIGQ